MKMHAVQVTTDTQCMCSSFVPRTLVHRVPSLQQAWSAIRSKGRIRAGQWIHDLWVSRSTSFAVPQMKGTVVLNENHIPRRLLQHSPVDEVQHNFLNQLSYMFSVEGMNTVCTSNTKLTFNFAFLTRHPRGHKCNLYVLLPLTSLDLKSLLNKYLRIYNGRTI